MNRVTVSVVGGATIAAFLAIAVIAAPADTRLADAVERGDLTAVQALVRDRIDVNAALADGTTPLHLAAAHGRADIVRVLLEAGANPAAENRYGITPLFEAAANPSSSVTAMLLKAGASANAVTIGGETVLMAAARYGNVDAARALVEAGADVNAAEPTHDQTALMFAAGTSHSGVVKVLLEHGAKTSMHDKVVAPAAGRGGGGGGGAAPPPAAGGARGAAAVARGGADAAPGAPQIAAPPAAQGAAGGGGRAAGGGRGGAQAGAARGGGGGRGGGPQPTGAMTALLYAARQGDQDSITSLLDAGADINEVDAQGWTALQFAINNTHYQAASLLIDRGANLDRADGAGRTPLYSAVDIHTAKPGSGKPIRPELDRMTSVQVAAALLAHGANANPKLQAGGNTPFLRAASDVDLAMMETLLVKGGDPAIVNDAGNNAIMMVVGMGAAGGLGVIGPTIAPADTAKAIAMCLDHGLDINATNTAGDTALHGAARNGNDAAVKALVAKGASLDVKNAQGFTPLDLAEGKGQPAGRAGPGGIQNPGHESTAELLKQLAAPKP